MYSTIGISNWRTVDTYSNKLQHSRKNLVDETRSETREIILFGVKYVDGSIITCDTSRRSIRIQKRMHRLHNVSRAVASLRGGQNVRARYPRSVKTCERGHTLRVYLRHWWKKKSHDNVVQAVSTKRTHEPLLRNRRLTICINTIQRQSVSLAMMLARAWKYIHEIRGILVEGRSLGKWKRFYGSTGDNCWEFLVAWLNVYGARKIDN